MDRRYILAVSFHSSEIADSTTALPEIRSCSSVNIQGELLEQLAIDGASEEIGTRQCRRHTIHAIPRWFLEGSRLINCRMLPCQVDVFRSSSMTDVALLIWLETTPLQNKPTIAICLVCFNSAGISWQRSRHVTLRCAEVLHRWSRRIEFNLSICCWTFFWIFEMQSKGPQGFQIFFPVLEMLKQSEVERQSL